MLYNAIKSLKFFTFIGPFLPPTIERLFIQSSSITIFWASQHPSMKPQKTRINLLNFSSRSKLREYDRQSVDLLAPDPWELSGASMAQELQVEGTWLKRSMQVQG